MQTLRSQHSLQTLVEAGGRLQRDAIALLDRAAFDGEEVSSAAVMSEVRFATAEARAEFMQAYLEQLRTLLDEYASDEGEAFRVVVAVHPEPGEEYR